MSEEELDPVDQALLEEVQETFEAVGRGFESSFARGLEQATAAYSRQLDEGGRRLEVATDELRAAMSPLVERHENLARELRAAVDARVGGLEQAVERQMVDLARSIERWRRAVWFSLALSAALAVAVLLLAFGQRGAGA